MELDLDFAREVDEVCVVGASSESSRCAPEEENSNEVQDPGFLESGSDEIEHLRIPYDKIKFGEKIDIHGYGTMFKGEFDHQQVALKRLNITNLAHIKPNLVAEILTIARFRQHPNLVALLGFCDEKSNEIVLVYEYVSSGNLADRMIKHLTTIQRLEICLGAARGVDHLHTGVDGSTPGIVHGDIKLSKILLSSRSSPSEFEAKVSGFGLSKLIPGQSRKTLDPMDKESDVYSFGVVLLEVLCGVRELVDTDDYQEHDVTELVPKRLEQNALRPIVHFDIREEITTESLETYAKIASLCVMKDPKQRPTIAQVVEELEKALKLQRKEPSDVHILGRSNSNGLSEETINQDDHKRDDDGLTIGSNIAEKNYNLQEIIDDPISSEQLDLSEANNGDEDMSINTSSEDTNGVKNAAQDITTDGEVSNVDSIGSNNGNGLHEETINEDDREGGDDDGETTISLNIPGENPEVKETIHDPMLNDPLGKDQALNIDKLGSKGGDSESKSRISMRNKIMKIITARRFFDTQHYTHKKSKSLIDIGKGNLSDSPIELLPIQDPTIKTSDVNIIGPMSGNGNGNDNGNHDCTTVDTHKPSPDGSTNCCSCACSCFFSNRDALYEGNFFGIKWRFALHG